MTRLATEAEMAERRSRIAVLASSPYVADRIVSVLMDSAIGGFGLYEDVARKKVTQILMEMSKV